MASLTILSILALALSGIADATAIRSGSTSESKSGAASTVKSTANPVRRVITMLQMMENKVKEEGKKEEAIFEKFMCYCKSGADQLGKSIGDAETKIPQLESDIKESEATKSQMDADVENAKTTRADAKTAMAKATSMREKEHAAFAKESAEDESNLDALTKALAAIEKGMAGGFLQTSAAGVLRQLSLTQDMSSTDRDLLASFLTSSHSQGYAPASGEIVGILKQMKDTMEKDLAEVYAQEESAKNDFEGLMAAKQKEIEAATKEIEEKIKRSGELAVEIVNLKEDLDDTQQSLAEDKQYLADLDKMCETRKKEWEVVCKTRQQELLAIAETIKILSDDDALELFKKTMPSPSLLQVEVSAKQVREQALRVLAGVKRTDGKGLNIDLISLALKSKKVDMSKVIKMIDDMVALLGKEQTDDDGKKDYCEEEFDKSDDRKKELERTISDLEKAITEQKEMVETLASEIKALEDGIYELDKDIAEATTTRKAEHIAYEAQLAANTAAIELIGFAKNRMQKFYNPKLYKPPPKRELTEEERITLNMGGTLAPTNPPAGIAGTGIGLAQTDNDKPLPPPPEAVGPYKKKGQESAGVLTMMDMLVADVEKETQEMTFEEKDAQSEYETMLDEGAKKRAADLKSIAEKEAAKAGVEAEIVANTDAKTGAADELMATKQYIADLHADCDWLIEKYQERKDARAAEVEALKNAKAVLSGADYSLMQTSRRGSLLHRL